MSVVNRTCKIFNDKSSLKYRVQSLKYLGWSVDTSKSLLRGDEDEDGTISNLGKLLKQKADEGVGLIYSLTRNFG